MVFFLFFEFFLLFFLEFSITRQIGKKRNNNFYFRPFSAFSNLFWLEMKPQWFFFFVLVMEFSITRRVGMKRNDNFYFLYFSAFSNLFWLEMKPQWYVLIFFFLLLWNFLLRVGKERNGTIIFIFSLSHPFPTYFGLKWRHNGFFFPFFEFFLQIFYYASDWKETERQFLFSPFLGLFQPILAWNEAIMVFFSLLNFFAFFFWIFSYASGRNETKW